eukprot:gnl/MRDRNA2_/MRDRNA2_19864_c0_seq1.p1 gnl/MRDRNA2_/MRDRNA2_19864_c0~~gnl/MRDRNA2_/MRDRNA2_19864_c0_seq1.p1  ORF type:complete len:535 (+),score=97.05 gnl/MRDRNA2_/MRDRNA2_19864_c0_seq1:313-1917(+)
MRIVSALRLVTFTAWTYAEKIDEFSLWKATMSAFKPGADGQGPMTGEEKEVSVAAEHASVAAATTRRLATVEGATTAMTEAPSAAAAKLAADTVSDAAARSSWEVAAEIKEVPRKGTEIKATEGEERRRVTQNEPPCGKPLPIQGRCKYEREVRSWAERVVIGLGLCPWAMKAQKDELLRYVTCEGDKPSDVARLISMEADSLTSTDASPLSSTLIICPHVVAWNDFNNFAAWVNRGEKFGPELETRNVGEKVVLVAFHPKHLQLYLEDLEIGTVVMSHYRRDLGTSGAVKSIEMLPATVTDSSAFESAQRVRVRFHKSNHTKDGAEQDVPLDWLGQHPDAPLPHNLMHQAPFPTVHLIRDADLKLSSKDLLDWDKVSAWNAGKYDKVHKMRTRNTKKVRQVGFEYFRKVGSEPVSSLHCAKDKLAQEEPPALMAIAAAAAGLKVSGENNADENGKVEIGKARVSGLRKGFLNLKMPPVSGLIAQTSGDVIKLICFVAGVVICFVAGVLTGLLLVAERRANVVVFPICGTPGFG